MSKKHRILIIDDNRTIVNALKLFLSERYEITTADNGLEGLKAIEQIENGIDLVITDLVMPELSGVVLISVIKKSIRELQSLQ
jgi:YesN/AraC family two-component response regulator